jgi:membrane-bound serine protease (ClpP class)
MPYWQVFLNALIDPTIAALLILLAAYGIITELTSPGAILPGVVGGIAGILAIVSLANLPVNIAGALLMLLALMLFVADLKANTHGILSFGGVLSLILGMAFLINTGPVGLGVDPIVIFGSAAISFAFFVFFVDRILRSRRRQVATGADAVVGSVGETREELSPEGLVFVRGALWKAVAQGGPIPVNSPVQVVGRSGLRLEVVPSAAVLVKEKE